MQTENNLNLIEAELNTESNLTTGYNNLLANEIIDKEECDNLITGITKETHETGVIYKITNKQNGLFYIGKTKSFRSNGNRKGAMGRFTEHYATARQQEKNNEMFDCPNFYPVLLKTKREDWTHETLLICKLEDLKKYETLAIQKLKSYLPEIGYNYFIADNMPSDGINNITYTTRKAQGNRDRAVDGKLKKSNKDLPANIYHRVSNMTDRKGNPIQVKGYFVQIKIKDVPASETRKGFMAKNKTMEENLELAKQWLAELKQKHGLA